MRRESKKALQELSSKKGGHRRRRGSSKTGTSTDKDGDRVENRAYEPKDALPFSVMMR